MPALRRLETDVNGLPMLMAHATRSQEALGHAVARAGTVGCVALASRENPLELSEHGLDARRVLLLNLEVLVLGGTEEQSGGAMRARVGGPGRSRGGFGAASRRGRGRLPRR